MIFVNEKSLFVGCCHSSRKLAEIKVMVEAFLREKCGVIALLNDLAVFHDEDHVGGLDGGESVRDDERGSSLHHLRERILNLELHTRVD